MRRFGGKFDEFKSSIKFDSRVFAPSGLNLADVLQKPSNFAADFWQNSHFENAGKFTSEFLMLANFGLELYP